MPHKKDIMLTAIAPAVWGSTYIITTETLPDGYPFTVAMLRALPAGLILLLWMRQLPNGLWWGKAFVLGALNFTIFWALLFIAAYTLPGGVAATVGAIQPLIVIIFAYALLGSPVFILSIIAALSGVGGIALLILSPDASFSPIGIAAGIGGAVSMAAGTVLTRKWQPPVPLLTFTAWQLTAGGILLVPLAIWFEPPLPALTHINVLGLSYLSLIGAALTYALWFRGIRHMTSSAISSLALLSPVTAVALGWLLLNQGLDGLQIIGGLTVLASIWLSQIANRPLQHIFSKPKGETP